MVRLKNALTLCTRAMSDNPLRPKAGDFPQGTEFVIKAKHDDVISDKAYVGFVFHFDNTLLIYTGDTGWSDEIEKQYKEIKNTYKTKKIILLLVPLAFLH